MVTGTEIMLWRRARKMTQGILSKHLGVSRQTVNNWEQGKTRAPLDLAQRLEKLAFTTAPKPVDVAPTHIMPRTAPKLYSRAYKGGYAPLGVHPASLVNAGFLAPEVLDGALRDTDGYWSMVPYTVLEDPRYLDAVERWQKSGRRIAADML